VAGSLGKDLLGLSALSADQLRLLLDTAVPFREISERSIKKVPTLRGATIVNLFFEASTRTRISFEFAEKRLSADTVNVAAAASSVTKGETLVDTARNLEAMRIDMVVIRHPASGAARFLAERIESNVVNAGDGTNEHPTQGLLDLLTLRDRLGTLQGKRVCIVGDVLHSRVARSNIWGLTKLGAEVAVCGPRSLLPNAIGEMGVTVFPQRPAPPAGAHAGRLHPVAARVQPRLRRHPCAPGAGAARPPHPAPRPHEPRRGNRQ
jgi:aspartate carbamoyltransferase catalytic subunit